MSAATSAGVPGVYGSVPAPGFGATHKVPAVSAPAEEKKPEPPAPVPAAPAAAPAPAAPAPARQDTSEAAKKLLPPKCSLTFSEDNDLLRLTVRPGIGYKILVR